MKEITNPGLKLTVLALALFMTSLILFGSVFAVTATNLNGEPNTMLSRIIAWGFVVTALGQLVVTMMSFAPSRQRLFKIAASILAIEFVGVCIVISFNS